MKDFSNVNTSPVYGEIEQVTQSAQATQEDLRKEIMRTRPKKERKTYTVDEAIALANDLNSSGRKGVKLPRINLAFTPDNYKYIKVMAQVRGQSLTEFINEIISKNREDNNYVYTKALEFRDAF